MMKVNVKVLVRALRFVVPLTLAAVTLACTTEPEAPPTVVAPNVQATVQAEVINQLAAVPTATAWPTHTPFPTATAYPTSTPYPTGTPLPTASPYPTATPYPTYTPYPTPTAAATPTPQPTYTPYPTPAPPALVIQQVPTPVPQSASAVQRPALGSFAELDTTGRVDHILRTHILGSTNCSVVAELSQELSRQQDAVILKVYNLRVFVSSSSRVECAGTARWSQGDDSSIYVFVENDRKGDDFYGYRSVARGFN